MLELFGLIITILAYLIWFVIKPMVVLIGSIIGKIRHLIILLLDFISRIIILVIVIAGAFFGVLLIINPEENIQFLTKIGIYIDNTIISEYLIFFNAIVLLFDLGILAIIIAKNFFKKQLRKICGMTYLIEELIGLL